MTAPSTTTTIAERDVGSSRKTGGMRGVKAGAASFVNRTIASANGPTATVAVDHPGGESVAADKGLFGTADEGEIRIRRAEPVVEFGVADDGCSHILALSVCVSVSRRVEMRA